MTVVSILSFGDSGAAIADEQATSYIRKLNVANKLRIINNFIFGGSGSLDFIEGIYRRIEKTLPVKAGFDKLQKLLPTETIGVINEFKNNTFYKNFGLPTEDILTKKLDEEIRKKANDCFESLNRYVSENVLLIGGLNNNQFEIYFFGLNNCVLTYTPLPYMTIGSGSDEAGRILSQYVEQKPKKEREKIDRTEGLIKLIEATNQASTANVGVGGTPQLMYCDKEGIKEIEEKKCVLASEIVKGSNFGQLNKNFVSQAITDLIFSNAKFEEVEEQMKKNAQNWLKFERLLRGYKI